MKAKKSAAWLLVLTLVVPAALAQNPRDRDEHRDRPPPAGFWPTDRMMDLVIDRMTEEMGKAYNFDDDQLYQTRELWKTKFPQWLNDNRGAIQPLVNDYFEALLEGQAPDPEYVAEWSQKVLPLVDEFTEVCESVGEGMRTYMTEEQQSLLDGHLAGFRVGMSALGRRLGNWAEGGFDADTEWHRSPNYKDSEKKRQEEVARDAQKAEREARGETYEVGADTPATGAESGRSKDKPASSSKPAGDDWARYVEDFIRRYQLNSDQQETAYKHLRMMQERRDGFLRRSASELEQARRTLGRAKGEAERGRAEQEVERLNRPLERMFTQLKEKLNAIPTRKQRLEATAGKPEQEARKETVLSGGKAEKP